MNDFDLEATSKQLANHFAEIVKLLNAAMVAGFDVTVKHSVCEASNYLNGGGALIVFRLGA